MRTMSEIQTNDPPCPFTDKPCHIWHHITIKQGLPCPCKCHYTNENLDEWAKDSRITNIDEVMNHLKQTLEVDGDPSV